MEDIQVDKPITTTTITNHTNHIQAAGQDTKQGMDTLVKAQDTIKATSIGHLSLQVEEEGHNQDALVANEVEMVDL
jgi:hypothetical protein